MHPPDQARAPRCTTHGKVCHRPSVESFTPAEQARFEAFCGALFKILSAAPPGRADLPVRAHHMGLD